MSQINIKSILLPIVIRKIIFNQVKLINTINNNNENIRKYNWYGLVKEPNQLINYNYIDIFFTEFDKLVNNSNYLNLLIRYILSLDYFIKKILLENNINSVVEKKRILQVIINKYSQFLNLKEISNHFIELCKNGNLELIEFLHNSEIGRKLEVCKSMDVAASRGYLDIVKFIHVNRTEEVCTTDAMDGAAENGFIEIVEFLHYNRTEGCTSRAMDKAIENGHYRVLKFLHENRSEGCTDYRKSNGHLRGFIEIHNFLDSNNSSGKSRLIFKSTMDVAAERGYYEIVQFLHFHRREGCTTRAMDSAAANGHLTIIEFLHRNRDEGCTNAAWNLSAKNGHLSIIQFLHRNSIEKCTTKAVEFASENNNISILKYIHENKLL